jgi:hypothetical protein
MQSKTAIALVAALILAGCATTTPPPRFAPVSPADPDAPESAPPPPSSLASEPEARTPSPAPAPAPAAAADGSYTCVMHPEVRQSAAGACSKCGMALVRQRQGSRP